MPRPARPGDGFKRCEQSAAILDLNQMDSRIQTLIPCGCFFIFLGSHCFSPRHLSLHPLQVRLYHWCVAGWHKEGQSIPSHDVPTPVGQASRAIAWEAVFYHPLYLRHGLQAHWYGGCCDESAMHHCIMRDYIAVNFYFQTCLDFSFN